MHLKVDAQMTTPFRRIGNASTLAHNQTIAVVNSASVDFIFSILRQSELTYMYRVSAYDMDRCLRPTC